MNESLSDIRQTIILTNYYSFDLGGYNIRELILKWTKLYPHHWLPLAVTEAIYQGRLKAISVEQILNVWRKKGCISYNFNYEFIRLIQPEPSFKLGQEKHLKDIVINHPEKQEYSIETSSPTTSKKILRQEKTSTKEDNLNLYASDFVSSATKMNEFKPRTDSSQCFQKLKSLAVNNRRYNPTKDLFY